MATPPKTSKTLKGSLKGTKDIYANDLSLLLRESEEGMKCLFKEEIKSIADRLSNTENNVSSIKMEAVRMDNKITMMKDVIMKQQMRVESHETKLRENNLIVHNISENDVLTDTGKLESDIKKVEFLCETIRVDIDADDIASCFRLGKRRSSMPRPLKIVLKEKSDKYKLLNARNEISQNTKLSKIFGKRIFVNPDNSFLVQREEVRLRQESQHMKKDSLDASLYIRSGTLYYNNMAVDKIDITNQIF